MSSYKVIYEGWQRHLSEAPSYDFKPGQTAADTKADPLNKIPANLARIVRDHAASFAQQMLNDGDAGKLIWFVKSVRNVGTYGKGDDQMYYVFEKSDGTPFNPMDEDVDTKDALGWYAPHQSVPNPTEIDKALGDAFGKIVLMSAEKLIGQELTLSWLTNKFPNLFHSLKNDLDFLKPYDTDGDQTLSDDELNQISLDDIPGLKNLPDSSDFDPEPSPEPAKAEPEADPDRRKLSPDEVAARKAQADASKAASDEPDDQDKIIAGINSREYPDSLINLLKPDPEKPGLIPDEQLTQLLQLLLKATEEDDIVLEALGGPDRDPRTFSPETTEKLNDLLDSFGLDPKVQKNLEKVLNKWAKLNTVKFSKGPDYGQALPPEELPPEASAPVDGDPQPVRTGDDPQPEDEEGTSEPGEDTEEKEELSTLGRVELGIEAALNTVSAAGVIPAFEATLIPSVATLGSLVFNLARGKMSAALLDIVALAPVVGKASKLGKLGPIGAKIAAKVGPASFKGGRLLIKTFGSAKNARSAITTMKSAKAAKDLAKAGSATKELIENVPEEWISAAIYKRQDDGDFWIDTVLGGVATLSSIPGIPDGIGTAADELNQSVESLRRAIPPPKGAALDPTDLPEPGMDPSELAETLDRWQTLAGINKRIL